MLKKRLTLLILMTSLALTSVQAQLAKQKDISSEAIMTQLIPLLQDGGADALARLNEEALGLVQSNNEQFVILGEWLYRKIDQADKADKVQAEIVKRFPKGSTARAAGYKAIFEDNAKGGAELEKTYRRWLKKYPANTFSAVQQDIYRRAAAQMAIRYFKEDNSAQADTYIEKIRQDDSFPYYANAVGSSLIEDEKYDDALPLLKEGVQRAQSIINSPDSAKMKSLVTRYYTALAPQYAKVLLETGSPDKAIEVLNTFFEVEPRASRRLANVKVLAEAYNQEGLKLEAFLLLNKFLIENGMNREVLAMVKPLYGELNDNQAGLPAYLSGIKQKAEAQLLANFKAKMIKKKAPLFSLLNRDGDTVELADLKGEVVVLDFWATWCGPCKISFPGMQAAVNKYKDDSEVEFLFIDTWQQEENYKELVDNFIKENNYTFNVLFDEMVDREKATTTSYGVRGIPHKVIIDKEGYIRFESSGGSADVDKLVNELETMIELARKG